MRKYIPNVIVIMLVCGFAYAAKLAYTSAEVDAGIAAVRGDTDNSAFPSSAIWFTNGWSISCTATSIVFVAP